MPAPIVLWFDFASPYAYFAWEAAERLAAAHGREIEWRPILLWAVLKAQSIPAPMDPPAKRAYFHSDMARSAAFHGVAYRAPDKFPISSHFAARLFYAIADADQARARALGKTLLASYFAENIDISETSALIAIAMRQGLSAEAAQEALEGEIGRRGLYQSVDAAVAAGVCGSPWFLVDGEPFFGADRLPQIAWRLSGVLPRQTEETHG